MGIEEEENWKIGLTRQKRKGRNQGLASVLERVYSIISLRLWHFGSPFAIHVSVVASWKLNKMTSRNIKCFFLQVLRVQQNKQTRCYSQGRFHTDQCWPFGFSHIRWKKRFKKVNNSLCFSGDTLAERCIDFWHVITP